MAAASRVGRAAEHYMPEGPWAAPAARAFHEPEAASTLRAAPVYPAPVESSALQEEPASLAVATRIDAYIHPGPVGRAAEPRPEGVVAEPAEGLPAC